MQSSCHPHKSRDIAVQHSVPHLPECSWLRKEQDQQEVDNSSWIRREPLMGCPYGILWVSLVLTVLSSPPGVTLTSAHAYLYCSSTHELYFKKAFYFEIQLISGESDSQCTLVSRRIRRTHRHNLRS